jgi:hypothetical protein
MRRVLLLLAIAAMLAAMLAEAGPAGAAAREPTSDPPGEASETIPDDFVGDTKPAGNNCYGQAASNHVKGPGGDPGGYAVPTEFPAGTPNYTGHAVSTLDPGQISDFQQQSRDAFAGESCDL